MTWWWLHLPSLQYALLGNRAYEIFQDRMIWTIRLRLSYSEMLWWFARRPRLAKSLENRECILVSASSPCTYWTTPTPYLLRADLIRKKTPLGRTRNLLISIRDPYFFSCSRSFYLNSALTHYHYDIGNQYQHQSLEFPSAAKKHGYAAGK